MLILEEIQPPRNNNTFLSGPFIKQTMITRSVAFVKVTNTNPVGERPESLCCSFLTFLTSPSSIRYSWNFHVQ